MRLAVKVVAYILVALYFIEARWKQYKTRKYDRILFCGESVSFKKEKVSISIVDEEIMEEIENLRDQAQLAQRQAMTATEMQAMAAQRVNQEKIRQYQSLQREKEGLVRQSSVFTSKTDGSKIGYVGRYWGVPVISTYDLYRRKIWQSALMESGIASVISKYMTGDEYLIVEYSDKKFGYIVTLKVQENREYERIVPCQKLRHEEHKKQKHLQE
jgi:predicted XRE-type DNA-binding protein